MHGTSIMKNSVKIILCILLVLVLVQAVQAAETYVFVTKWGTQGLGDGQFSGPSGVAVDSSGNIYVADGTTIASKSLIQPGHSSRSGGHGGWVTDSSPVPAVSQSIRRAIFMLLTGRTIASKSLIQPGHSSRSGGHRGWVTDSSSFPMVSRLIRRATSTSVMKATIASKSLIQPEHSS